MSPRPTPWNRPPGRRGSGTRALRRYLVVCEDEKSSRYYFEALSPSSDYVAVDCVGTGFNTDTLMKEAVRRKREAEDRGDPYVTVWCVFDRDEHPIDRYSRPFDLARAHGIEAVWSNEAFELWYLLHFEFRQMPAHRHDLLKLVEQRLGKQYAKGDRAVADWFALGEGQRLRGQACANARKLIALHGERAKFENPSTQIHEVVEKFEELHDLEEKPSRKRAAP